ncbi:hypothetical protein BCV70DRAFT_203099 [Testicularia cyperi]|uniref:RRM domain-containing protein n=1 Tax=Testicularia cyperi TaxID=1882483 RepID=A0A317XGF0_9BASI|nr:hypothetical protein BCV70DRAFT_203099 [Testicularia cyperi]
MEDTKLTKKQQKAAQFKAAKKGKTAVEPAVADEVTEVSTSQTPKADVKASKKEITAADATKSSPVEVEKPEKRNKKRKRLEAEAEAAKQAEEAETSKAVEKKEKAEKKAPSKVKAAKSAAGSGGAGGTKTTFGDDGEVAESLAVAPEPAGAEEESTASKGAKFIIFVGNMSFKTTQETISKHFTQHCGETPSVRLLTTKADPKALEKLSASKRKSVAKGKAEDPSLARSKGCAFIEFKTSQALKKALQFHHTMLEGRKINVELTAGGGGKSSTRQEKIKKKNAELEKERTKLHGKYVAPKNEARKSKTGEKTDAAAEPKAKKPRTAPATREEQPAQWGRSTDGKSRERKMPRFMATGSNAVRVAPTS